MFNYLWPLGLVVLSNVFYNIITKSTPADVNVRLSLTMTYGVAAICSFIMFLMQGQGKNLVSEVSKLNWTSYALGLSLMGLEFGYICIYRAGWKVSVAPMVNNICLTCILIVVGYFLYKETITVRQLIGMAVCAVGLFLVTK